MVFVFIVAIVAGRRAHLKVLAIAALALCFVVGSLAWVARNEIQVHRIEYVDSVQTDAVFVASMNGGPTHLKKIAFQLLNQPTISAADRAQ